MPALGVIGECMLELRPGGGEHFALGYAGDAFNTAVYASRLGLDVNFISALGDDHYSAWLLEHWQMESLRCGDVRVIEGASPGLYLIRNDAQGERYFHYWRDASPFRQLLAGVSVDAFTTLLRNHDWVYVTGIGLALLPAGDRETLLNSLKRFRGDGGKVAFDPNYRPVLWPDREEARRWIDRTYEETDIALPSIDDESALRPELGGSPSEDRLREFMASLTAREVVVKRGNLGVSVKVDGDFTEYPIANPVHPVDATAAGDSFNAAYLHSRIAGQSIDAAIANAQALAAAVVMHRGAIISKELWAEKAASLT